MTHNVNMALMRQMVNGEVHVQALMYEVEGSAERLTPLQLCAQWTRTQALSTACTLYFKHSQAALSRNAPITNIRAAVRLSHTSPVSCQVRWALSSSLAVQRT